MCHLLTRFLLVAPCLCIQGKGSLLQYLKDEQLAEGVSTGLEVDARGFALFTMSVSLNPRVKNNSALVDDVVQALYGYIHLTRQVRTQSVL